LAPGVKNVATQIVITYQDSWQQLSVGNSKKSIKDATPSCISQMRNSFTFVVAMNGMLKLYSCEKKSALRSAVFL
jgi:hypothetical protein